MRIEGWVAQNCRFAGSDALVTKALNSVMMWKISLGKEKFAEILAEAGTTPQSFTDLLRSLLQIKAVPPSFRYVFVDLLENPWTILDQRTIEELKTVTEISTQGKIGDSEDRILLGLAGMAGHEDRLLAGLKDSQSAIKNDSLMAQIFQILMSNISSASWDWGVVKSIFLLRPDLFERVVVQNPALFAQGFYVYSWMFNPQDFSEGARSAVLDSIAGMQISSLSIADDVVKYLSRVNPPLADKAKAVYDTMVRNNPTMLKYAISLALAHNRSPLELPETGQFIASQIKGLSSNPSALAEVLAERGEAAEERLKDFGVELPEDMTPIYEEAIGKFSAGIKSQGEILGDDEIEVGTQLMNKFSGTESSRKALLSVASKAKSAEDLPGLKSVFYLRADLLPKEEMYAWFLNAWKMSGRTHNAQAIQLVVNDDPRMRGAHPVEPFFDDHTPVHFSEPSPEPGVTGGEYIIRSLTSQGSYDAMKKTFQEIYQETQRTLVADILAKDKYAKDILVKDEKGAYTGLKIFRGVSKGYSVPSTLESWTSSGSVAHSKFDGHSVWLSPVPLSAVLIAYVSPHWGEDFAPGTMECEYEYIVARSFINPQGISKNVFQ